MVDSTENDGHAEPIMDYIISWCLRWAMQDYANTKSILYNYCKRMLCILLKENNVDTISFTDVKTWKQYYKIDLWVEAILLKNNIEEKHAILIENKYYTPLHLTKDDDGQYKNQLEVYRKKFDKYYKEQSKDWETHYALITCIDRNDEKFSQYEEAYNYGYEIYSFYELLDGHSEETESDIFNEFWLKW